MDPVLLFINGVVFLLLGVKMIRGGLRGTEAGSDPVSLGISRTVSPPSQMSQRERFWAVGLGASIATIGVLNFARAVFLMVRQH
jgi:hypothetical protein